MFIKIVLFFSIFCVLSQNINGRPQNFNKHNAYPEERSGKFQGDMIIVDRVDNGLLDEDSRWPNGIVPYKIIGSFNLEDTKMIEKVINEYSKHTCIKFIPKTDEDKDYIEINNDPTGCWSYVGRVGGNQTVNLQSPGCLWSLGTPIHELMHAIGFHHEQSRYDRDEYVNVIWDNIEGGQEDNFEKYNEDIITTFGVSYDYESVMHYSSDAFSKNGKDTIEPKESNTNIGNRENFSELDIVKINKMYCDN